jgi:acid phosphatase
MDLTKLTSAALGMMAVFAVSTSFAAEQNDNLNATLWTQHSVEFKASAMTAYALATIRLDQALQDKAWTALPPAEQGENYADRPPAVILDVDETVLDNSPYQAWLVLNDESFHPRTWASFVNTVTSRPVPGSLAFAKYAESKGVKVFYVSNRDGKLEEATRKNLARFGYPMGGNVDTVLLKKEKPAWKSSKKSPRRSHVGKDYRVLLLIGDNFGDFVDGYKDTQKGRAALMTEHGQKWGREWIVIANPTYGSWESAPYGFDYKLRRDEKRARKTGTLEAWSPTQ